MADAKSVMAPPRLNAALLWVALVAMDTSAQLFFKAAATRATDQAFSWRWLAALAVSPAFMLAVLCLVLTLPVWLLILRSSMLGVAFAATALTYAGVVGGSRLIFGEPIGALQYASIVLIAIGVALMRSPVG
jgi:hypothetical protein